MPGQEEWPLLILCLFAFALALGCRENAIVLPGILLAGDLLSGTWRPLRRRIRCT